MAPTPRERLEQIEEMSLAPYATKSALSLGRTLHGNEHDDYRTCFQRDRDRILYSKAFKDLQYKTQVFLITEGDFYRTRLTHTLEVAQHARTFARVLGLNEDLCEAIAYAHDLGHTPFGHAGEEELDEIMKDDGGFEHNIQSLRIVDFLEKRYRDYDGLNLCLKRVKALPVIKQLMITLFRRMNSNSISIPPSRPRLSTLPTLWPIAPMTWKMP